jgi:predicted acyltransferase
MEKNPSISNRLLSLDFMRGLIMVLLALESTRLYENLVEVSAIPVYQSIIRQFFHHPWHGLRFWDLVQPGFMFIAGTAMAFSLEKQWQKGISWKDSFKKILKRCFWLFFWGVLNYAVQGDGSLSFELWNVLTQLSFTTLIAFLIYRWSYPKQIMVCIGLLLLTEYLYRFMSIPGFDQSFTDQHNFGNFMDLVLMNKINPGGWVAINCIPTAVHTIAGAMTGKFLLHNKQHIRPLFIWGIIILVSGYAIDLAGITPIIKRIATSSFTLASLGWCILALASIYWWVDIKEYKKYLSFFTIVGMNSIFIYLFFEIVGSRWFNEYVGNITNGLMSIIYMPHVIGMIITSLILFSIEWFMCYFLYRKNIYFKL